VARKAAISSVGRSEMKPTVSESRTLRFDGSVTERMVGSRVANICDEAYTSDFVTTLNRVLLPAFV